MTSPTEVWLYYDHQLAVEQDREIEHRLRATKRIDGHTESLEVRYRAERAPIPEIVADASSPIGLFRDQRQTISWSENERLERCLADLLMCQLHPHLQDLRATILIEGPPLSKLVGRIAYRYPRPEINIAFVTVDERYFAPPPYHSDREWDGPFPDLQEESLTRRFYSIHEPRVRVDLLTQTAARLSLEEHSKGTLTGPVDSFYRHTRSVGEFGQFLRERDRVGIHRLPIVGEVRPLPFPEHRAAQQLAARSDFSNVPASAETSSTPARPAPHSSKVSQHFTDHEAFAAIFGEPHSKMGKGRLGALVKFANDTDLGPLGENVEFLRFIRETLKALQYSRSASFSQRDLTRWYEEFREGRPGSAA